MSKLKGCASVVLSPVTSQRVATKGAFATHATSAIPLVCMKRETKANKVQVKTGQLQVRKGVGKGPKQHNVKQLQ